MREISLGLHEAIHMAQEDRPCIVGSPALWFGNRCTVERFPAGRRIAITAGQGSCWKFPESLNDRLCACLCMPFPSPTFLYRTIDGAGVPPRLRISARHESTRTVSCTGVTKVTVSWTRKTRTNPSSGRWRPGHTYYLSQRNFCLDQTP